MLCHTRVLPISSFYLCWKAAQVIFPFDAAFAQTVRTETQALAENHLPLIELWYWKPWSPLELSARLKPLDTANLAALCSPAGPPGDDSSAAVARQSRRNSRPDQIAIPVLIASHSGLQHHGNASVTSLRGMRPQPRGGDDFADFGGFVPMAPSSPVARN